MRFFDLPVRTHVGRVIPKNTFDDYTNTRQKKLFTDYIQRISWLNKLSVETVNLEAKDIQEIQVFRIELKKKAEIPEVLKIIDKSISYHIVFWVNYLEEVYLSTAAKHPHPTNENISVIDWTFTTQWFQNSDNPYQFNLKGNIDAVFKDFCIQLTGKPELASKPLEAILHNQQMIDRLTKEITKLKKAIPQSKQFNEKVELNLRLKTAEKELNALQLS